MLFEGRQDIQTELQYRDSEKSILRFPKDTAKIIRSKNIWVRILILSYRD